VNNSELVKSTNLCELLWCIAQLPATGPSFVLYSHKFNYWCMNYSNLYSNMNISVSMLFVQMRIQIKYPTQQYVLLLILCVMLLEIRVDCGRRRIGWLLSAESASLTVGFPAMTFSIVLVVSQSLLLLTERWALVSFTGQRHRSRLWQW